VSDLTSTILFLGIASTLWGGLHFYIGRRLLGPLKLEGRRKLAARIGIVVAFFLAPLTFIGGRVLEGPVLDAFELLSFLYMGVFAMVAVFVLVRDLVLLIRQWVVLRKLLPDRADEERRRFLTNVTNAGVLGSTGIMSAWGYYEATRLAEVIEVEIPIPNLPPDLEGYRIAQISDVHIGPSLKGAWLREIVDKVNGLDADMIAVTGDLIDGFVDDLRRDIAPLGDLRARDGAFFVTGNHEYYWDAEAWCAHVSSLGLHVLVNEHRVIERGDAKLLVAGITDIGAERFLPSHASDPKRALEGAPREAFRLLLAHQPKSAEAAHEAGFQLQLSGHTHGGQFFPFSVLVHLVQPFTAGLAHLGEMAVYVNRGTGYWGPPLRQGVPAEITLARLVRA
jgi:uncharacterized protein